MKKLCILLVMSLLTASFGFFDIQKTKAADAYSQAINLSAGWNAVSAPRLVDSHQFSAAETTANFEVYVLNPASASGWSTMADINQSEFTPLYGYFINNKTSANQTLTLNYKQNVEPNQRLFSRALSAGWNVVGVANPSYALKRSEPGSTDTNNVSNILNTLSGCAGAVLDVTAGQSNKSSAKVSDAWNLRVWNDVNQLNDLRETKAYAVYIINACTLQGSQDNTAIAGTGVLSVAKNSSLTSNAIGVPGGIGVKIASFVITAGSGEATDVTQIVLKDANTTTQLGDNFTNLTLKNGTNRIGEVIGTLDNSGTAATYTFTLASAIRLNAGDQYVVDVYADIKFSPQDMGAFLSPVAYVDSISATGVNTGADVGLPSGQNLALQDAYISESSNLTITNSGTTASQQLVMGATDQEVAKFTLTANGLENVNITSIYLAASLSPNATGTVSNLRLYNGATPVGAASNFSVSTSIGTYAVAPFAGLNLTVLKDDSVNLTVKADVSTSDNATSGATITFALLPDYDGVIAGAQESITARGATSGLIIAGDSLDFSNSPDAAVAGNTMAVYASKISVAYAGDTPSGGLYAPQAGQAIMKFTVNNPSNAGNHAAIIKSVNLNITPSGIIKTPGARVDLNIYKDSVMAMNLVGTMSWPAGDSANIGNTNMSNTADVLAIGTTFGFNDVMIAPGTTNTFFVTLDTNNLGINGDPGKTITVGIPTGGVVWRDGVGIVDITTVNTLPSGTRTLVY